MVRWAAVPKRTRVNIALYVVAALSGMGLTAEIVLGGSPPVSTELAIGSAPAPKVTQAEGLGPTVTPFEPLPPLEVVPVAPSPLGGLRLAPAPRPRSSGAAPKVPKPASRFQPVAERQPVELNLDDPKQDDPKPDPTTTTRPPTTTTRPPTTTTTPTTKPTTTTTPTTLPPTTTTPTTNAPTTTTPTTTPPTTTTPTTNPPTSTTSATTTTSPAKSANPPPPGFFGGGRRLR
ncbi:MAG: hypothetical protein ACRD0Q_06890 [Acidimicrobiales bacterium]